ncbi:UDP-N-acetylmuramate dehydrogenase [Hydrogenivirga sp. 128-5-R1-1]|uniref:UDP-N-acetylmuramate dehydrogenase n=1 Tax=Hydrogenivirga sp. 128-5-R1-1 TaxID=392423 RepID=UPI00015F0E30|nr:UDP-N-acetylmuramate dehydrogenase [Hydrogenivirga sp. 128-5-R1-1]EDP74259.1 UDP-N-acetylenolpyruvoylglucosamine reductase [Hydrogenivirga sp. 128-5-R1-1]
MKIYENVDLKNFSTIKIGGKAKKLYFPESLNDIKFLIKKSKDEDKKLVFIGVGSNTIFKDGTLDYIFISTKFLKNIEIKEEKDLFYLNLEAGVSFKEIINLVKKFNLEGFENLSGIPASLGGAVAMNAGAFGNEIFDIIEDVLWIDFDTNEHLSKKNEIKYSYRTTQFQKEGFIYKATIKLKKSKKDIAKIIKNHLIERNKKQPLNLPTSGSTYKNPPNNFAGKILEEIGYKGKRIGDIGFSDKHANFLVNYSNATFKDLMNLLESAERKVERVFNIKFEREIRIVE